MLIPVSGVTLRSPDVVKRHPGFAPRGVTAPHFASLMRATPAPRIASHVERAGGEQFLKLDPARAQSLLVHVLRDGLEHRPRGLEAITQRIIVGERALDAVVEQSGFEIPVQV